MAGERKVTAGEETVTQLAKSALVINDQLRDAVPDVTGEKGVSIEEFTEAYLNATFEERMRLFLETFGTSGADGLEFLAEVQDRATKQFQKEGLI
ncbi:hypothetical protein LCGC14_2881160 [marine sediment metagenome]|uniref:Uncharacterized protein n=1 Tax=marine sediment metagenome TaxID=412755 RepID=A0A0F9A810_9ZZZZ